MTWWEMFCSVCTAKIWDAHPQWHGHILLKKHWSAVPLYVGVVDSSVVQVMAERGDHQSQDLQIAHVTLTEGRTDRETEKRMRLKTKQLQHRLLSEKHLHTWRWHTMHTAGKSTARVGVQHSATVAGVERQNHSKQLHTRPGPREGFSRNGE